MDGVQPAQSRRFATVKAHSHRTVGPSLHGANRQSNVLKSAAERKLNAACNFQCPTQA